MQKTRVQIIKSARGQKKWKTSLVPRGKNTLKYRAASDNA